MGAWGGPGPVACATRRTGAGRGWCFRRSLPGPRVRSAGRRRPGRPDRWPTAATAAPPGSGRSMRRPSARARPTASMNSIWSTPASKSGNTGVPLRMADTRSASTRHSPRSACGISSSGGSSLAVTLPTRGGAPGVTRPSRMRWAGTSSCSAPRVPQISIPSPGAWGARADKGSTKYKHSGPRFPMSPSPRAIREGAPRAAPPTPAPDAAW
jgi:hypothetical protein